MRWQIDAEKAFWLRRLLPTDIEPTAEFAGRAFNSLEVTDKIYSMLNIYCAIGAHKLRFDQQKSTLLPVVYYLLVTEDITGEIRLGLSGLYYPLWAGKGVFWLGWFAVAPQFQGQGNGARLLRASVTLAAARGGRLMCIETASDLDAALRLYGRLGFRSAGTIPDYWSPGLGMLILQRTLTDLPIPKEIPYDL